MTFQGDKDNKRWPKDAHPHESPLLMTAPMMILAIGSAVLGLALGVSNGLVHWLEPVVGAHAEEEPVIPAGVLIGLTTVLVLLGVALAWRMYWQAKVPLEAPRGSLLTRAARRDLFQDDLNEALFMRPGQYLTRWLVYVDNRGVDGAVGGLAALVGGLGGRLRRVQTGLVRSYAASMLAGVVILLGGVLAVRI
jgi:NADH-quinone oxidoreductase subunit L